MMHRELHYGDRVFACHEIRPSSVYNLFSDAVSRNAEGIAMVCDDVRMTYAALADEVKNVAAGLSASGVEPGDRIAMLLGNGVPFVVLTYAAAYLGAVTVPLNTREQLPGICHSLRNSGAKVLVIEAEFHNLAPPAEDTPDLIARFAVGPAKGFKNYEELRTSCAAVHLVDTKEDAVATILYTSGTTGVPKGATLTGLGIVHSAINFVQTMRLGPTDTTVVVVPMTHVTGLVAGIHTVIHCAGTIVVLREFKAAKFLETAAKNRMTYSLLVPAMYNLCLHQADLNDFDLADWRIGGYGGAPMPAATIERLGTALPNLGLMNAYGATETTSPATIMPADQTAARRLSVGRPVPGAEICVMGDTGQEVPLGEIGELWIRGAMVVPGYWRNPEADVREFTAGFWKSGDIGKIDADGYVHVLDRKKDMVNRGGYKIFTAEVESVLSAFAGVIEAAVVAKPCLILGERVHAVLSVKPEEVDEEQIKAHCSAELADYQCPESYTFRDRLLPRNANGKIIKRQIKQELGFGAS